MNLAALVETGAPALLERHGHHLTQNQRQALQAIQDCRSGALGSGLWQCHDCQHTWQQHRSCGHRACPRCQHHHASDWVSRQTAKLLPAPYFMLTFTLPAGLRPIAYAQPRCMYNLLFEVAMQALRRFANNHPDFGAEPGACAVLHTHSRRLEYHPHVHIIVPAAVIDRRRQQWRKLRGRYLFNGNQLATVFRAKMLDALRQGGLPCPARLPKNWVVQCQHVGKGAGAVKYLSRYLYRGVVREQDILDFDPQTQQVRIRYRESKSSTD